LSRVINGDDSWIYGYDPETKEQFSHWKNPNSPRLFTKTSSWQTKWSIPHTTVMFCGECIEICEDIAPNFGDKKLYAVSQQRTVSPGNFFY
jgi:hypothetical protein